jgi:hypothetical protein
VEPRLKNNALHNAEFELVGKKQSNQNLFLLYYNLMKNEVHLSFFFNEILCYLKFENFVK